MKTIALAAVLVATFCGPSLAHTGQGVASGFFSGLAHPVLGADHLLAMIAVGLWSGFALPRHLWAGAATFLSAMAIGAALCWAGVGFPLVEGVITASVLGFGLLVLMGRRDQAPGLTAASLGMIGLFALAHGHAHASEASGQPLAYLAGFLVATAGLHLGGLAVARAISRPVGQKALGAGVALSGLLLMVG